MSSRFLDQLTALTDSVAAQADMLNADSIPTDNTFFATNGGGMNDYFAHLEFPAFGLPGGAWETGNAEQTIEHVPDAITNTIDEHPFIGIPLDDIG